MVNFVKRHCSDACCYAGTISPEDLAANKSATPCRRHQNSRCLYSYRSPLLYGFAAPWIFILSAGIVLSLGLWYDWKTEKKCFAHITGGEIRIMKAENIQNNAVNA